MKFTDNMFDNLEKINQKPKLYQFYTAQTLWADKHISKKMLQYHLDDATDLASRNKGFINKAVDWMAKCFDIGSQTKICDFGCGPGLYTTLFAKKGAQVTGVDFSEGSIEYARKTAVEKNLQIDYIHQDYLKFTTDKTFDLITLIYCDFCPLSWEQRQILLGKFHDYLKPGGKIILDVHSLNFYESMKEQRAYGYSAGNGFWAENPYYVFHSTFKYDAEKVTLDKYVIIEENGTREIYNWLQCYSLESLTDELAANGFRVVAHYSDVSGAPYQPDATVFAVVAEKN